MNLFKKHKTKMLFKIASIIRFRKKLTITENKKTGMFRIYGETKMQIEAIQS